MKNEKKTGATFAAPKKSRKDINRDGQAKLNAELNAKAQAAGWSSWSEFRTAVRKGEITIPSKRA